MGGGGGGGANFNSHPLDGAKWEGGTPPLPARGYGERCKLPHGGLWLCQKPTLHNTLESLRFITNLALATQ